MSPQGALSARWTLPEGFNTSIDVHHCIMVTDAGHGSTLFINVGLLLRKMSRMFENLVGNLSICSRLRSCKVVRNASLVDLVFSHKARWFYTCDRVHVCRIVEMNCQY